MAGWVGGLKYPVLIPAKSFASLSCSSILAWLHWSVSLGAGTMWTFHARTANSSALNLLFSLASAQHKYSFKIIWSLFQMTHSLPAQSGETRCPLIQMMFWYFCSFEEAVFCWLFSIRMPFFGLFFASSQKFWHVREHEGGGGRQGWVNTQPVEAGECVCKVSDVRKEEEGKHGGDAKILVDDGGNHIDQYARHHGESCLCALVLFRFLFEEFTSRAPLPSSCHLVVWSVPIALATSWCLPHHKFIAPRGLLGSDLWVT